VSLCRIVFAFKQTEKKRGEQLSVSFLLDFHYVEFLPKLFVVLLSFSHF